ncbi:TPA: DUF3275 family protein [Salmonella enterica]|nr:DUF3275 family protein [Salmonella enterica]
MNTESASPVIVTGSLLVKAIHGKYGEFKVGLLETNIGCFSVKDQILEQYRAGRYKGQFVINNIAIHAWTYGANSGTEIRARLSDIIIDTNESLSPGDEQKMLPPVNDPLDEEAQAAKTPPAPETPPEPARPVPAPASGSSRAKRPQFTVPTPAERESVDQTLFGALWPLGDIVKLDSTAPRQILRQQTARLGQLGYEFIAQEQHFVKTAASETVLH